MISSSVRRFALVGVLFLGGCATVHHPPATFETLAADAEILRATESAVSDTVVARLARRAVIRGDHTLDILILSGGGQNGAYGAGFLRGWRTRPDAPMPEFDLVTGISTGALQSPFALLGTEASLDTLASLYRHASERIAPTINWWFCLRRDGGLLKTGRLEQTIERELDEEISDQLRAQFGRDRQITIATTDFDLGVGRRWDFATELGAASEAPRGRERIRTLLLAATALPGLFPPRILDGHIHADGGVMGNLLLGPDLQDYRALAKRLRELGVTDTVTIRAWIVMNYWTHARPLIIDPASRKAMKQRTDILLFSAQQPQLLLRMSELTEAVTAGVPGLRMELRCTSIPSELASEPGASQLFTGEWMQRLEKLGFDRARGPAPWGPTPPDPFPSSFARPLVGVR